MDFWKELIEDFVGSFKIMVKILINIIMHFIVSEFEQVTSFVSFEHMKVVMSSINHQ